MVAAAYSFTHVSCSLDLCNLKPFSNIPCCAVLEDLLWGFMGFEGKYIRANRARSSRGSITFQLNGKLDSAVNELVLQMLPIWYVRADALDTILLLQLLLRLPQLSLLLLLLLLMVLV